MKDCTEESIEVQVVIETKNLSAGSVMKTNRQNSYASYQRSGWKAKGKEQLHKFIPLSVKFGVTVRKEIPECGIITISNFQKKRTWFYLRYRIPDDWIESYETQDAVVHLLNLGDSWRFSWSQVDIMWRLKKETAGLKMNPSRKDMTICHYKKKEKHQLWLRL